MILSIVRIFHIVGYSGSAQRSTKKKELTDSNDTSLVDMVSRSMGRSVETHITVIAGYQHFFARVWQEMCAHLGGYRRAALTAENFQGPAVA